MPAIVIVIVTVVVTAVVITAIVIVISATAAVMTRGAVAGAYPAVAERPAYALRVATLAGEPCVVLGVTA